MNNHQGATQEGGDAHPEDAERFYAANCRVWGIVPCWPALNQAERDKYRASVREFQLTRQSAPRPVAEASEQDDKDLTHAYSEGRADEREEWAPVLEALQTLEIAANTVNACYTRNPGNFAAALRDLREYAEAARAAAIAKVGAK